LVEEARFFVEENLARMNDTRHYSVGFAILHHGSGAKSLLTHRTNPLAREGCGLRAEACASLKASAGF
jgi:hypothetical protein